MNYKITFGIDYGVSYWLGAKFPDYLEIEKNLVAEDDFKALIIAIKEALKLGRDYPNNPKTDFTTITLIKLHNENKNLINQKETLKKQGYTGVQKFKWDENHRLFTRYSRLEQLIMIKFTKKIPRYNFSMN